MIDTTSEIQHVTIQYTNQIVYDRCPGCGGSIMYVWRKPDSTVGEDQYVPICLDQKYTGCLQ